MQVSEVQSDFSSKGKTPHPIHIRSFKLSEIQACSFTIFLSIRSNRKNYSRNSSDHPEPMNSICQSLSHTTHKIYGKCTAAILFYLKLPAELSINSYWLLKFVLLSVINFIGWRVYRCLVKFFGCIFFKQLIYHLPTTREIKACDVYYTCRTIVFCHWQNISVLLKTSLPKIHSSIKHSPVGSCFWVLDAFMAEQ